MRVGIDLRMVGPVPHGIARYALALWNRLPARADRTYVAVAGPTTPALAKVRPNDEILLSRSRFLSPLEQLELPALLHRARIDLLHATSFSVPAAWRRPLVLTLHDLTHLEVPELRSPLRVAYYRAVVGPAARRAKAILTVSRYSKELIARELRVPEERITVAPNAVERQIPLGPRPLASPPLLLAVGTAKAHKNIALLVEMHRLLRQPARLALVGPGLSRFEAPGIEIKGVLDDGQLEELYRTATLFLCPSRCEGFGLTPLEAAQCGMPMIAARAGALPEIWSEAALLLPPTNARLWAETVDQLLSDDAEREALAARCAARAERYQSWNALVEAADAAYGT